MATLAETRTRVAGMLSRSDLDDEIDAEIGRAAQRYARELTWLTEFHAAELDTVIDQQWYSSFDLSTADAIQDVTGRTSVSFTQVQKIDSATMPDGTLLIRESYDRMAARDAAITGTPSHYALYGGRLALWPVPLAVQVITLAGQVKPVTPDADDEDNVFLDRCEDLIENAAVSQVLVKFVQDVERARVFAEMEQRAFDEIIREGNIKRAMGRLEVYY